MDEQARWRRQSAELDRLLDLAPSARADALARIAALDPALAAELADLLQASDRTGPLERGLGGLAQDALAQADPAPADAAGSRIGHWRLIEPIGRGGMGEVFLAERLDGGFSQRAALKRLKRGMDSEEILRRFLQERQILATLNHPRIARLLDGGLDASDRPYLVMEYVQGVPITQWARAAGLGLRARVALLCEVCDAVAYAQRHLVVHRDIKPSNILVDPQGVPHLLDFGIAKLLGDAADPQDTRTGLRILSPAYAAPEQLRGDPVSTATDVHALGVVLYELLTGALPWRADRGSAGLAPDQRDTLVRPSQRLRRLDAEAARALGAGPVAPARLARQVAGDLDRIVLAALRPEPQRRYPSAAALATDLRLYLDGRPILARPDSSLYRLRKFVLRHRVGTAAGLLVLAALLGGFGTALWQARLARAQAVEAERQRALAESHLERAQAQARRAEDTKRFVVSLLQSGNPELARDGVRTTAVDLIRDAATRVDALTDAPDTQAELQVAIGNGLLSLGAREDGAARLAAGIAQLRTLGEDARPALAEALHLSAMHATASGQLDAAQRDGEAALALFDALGTAPDTVLRGVATRTTLAKIAVMRGALEQAQQQYAHILERRRALLGADDPRLAVDWNNLGSIALRRDRYADAEQAYAEAMRLLALDPAAPRSRLAWLHLGHATTLAGLGRQDAAAQALRDALAVAEDTLHAEHPIVASIALQQATLERHRGRLDVAAAAAERALAIRSALQSPELPATRTELALIRLAQGRARDAARLASEARAPRAAGTPPIPAQALADAVWAAARVHAGDPGALAALDAAVALAAPDGSPPGNAGIEALLLRSAVARRLGQPDAAHWQQRAVAALDALLGAAHPRTRAARDAG